MYHTSNARARFRFSSWKQCGLLMVGLTLLCAPSIAHAKWSDEITTSMWNAKGTSAPNTYDCAQDSVYGFPTPGRPAGGWSEWRFWDKGPGQNVPQFFQGMNYAYFPTNSPPDFTRFCPRTFNEQTMNHGHGVLNVVPQVFAGQLFLAFDMIGEYFSENRVIVAQDPSLAIFPSDGVFPITSAPSLLINNKRPYGIVELARNPRRYISINPGSADYQGRFDTYGTQGVMDPGDGCQNVATPKADSKMYWHNGWMVNRSWWATTRTDLEGTFCAPPGIIQTFDPDFDIRNSTGGAAIVAWTERVAEGKFVGADGSVQFGFDEDAGTFTTKPGWFPFRKLEVHVEKITPTDLPGGHDNIMAGRIPHTGLTGASGLNIGTSEYTNAMSPRIAQVELSFNARTYPPVVVWAEADFQWRAGEHQAKLDDGRVVGDGIWGPANVASPLASGTLYAKQNTGGTAWTPLGPVVGQICNIQEVSSGRATGRKHSFGYTHDVAMITQGTTERPIVVFAEATPGGQCALTVKLWTGTSWTQLGGDLRTLAGSLPSFPKITVHNNIPYVTWTEVLPNARKTVVKRARNMTDASITWDSLALDWAEGSPTQTKCVSGPSIVVTDTSKPATSVDDGANVYVSVNENQVEGSDEGDTPRPLGSTDQGPCVVAVYTCKTRVSSVGEWSCSAPPTRYADKARPWQSGQHLPVYRNAGHMGYSWGIANVKAPELPKGNLLPTQIVGFLPDSRQALPSNTGLAIADITPDGKPDSLFVSFTGPVQNHRANDRGAYARRDAPLIVEKNFVALGGTAAGSGPQGPGHAIWARIDNGSGSETLYAWGANDKGQLGIGTVSTREQKPQVVTIASEQVSKIAAGGKTSAAITASGRLLTWGDNTFGQLCNGVTTGAAVLTPTQVAVGQTFVDVSVGDGFLVALDATGRVFSCGKNESGQLGNYTTSAGATATPQTVKVVSTLAALDRVTAVSAGGAFACALRSDGAIFCWGKNDTYQTGRGTAAAYYNTAARIANTTEVFKQVSAGGTHALALSASGTPYAWGNGENLRLGTGTVFTKTIPTPLTVGVGGIIEVLAGRRNSYMRVASPSGGPATLQSVGADSSGAAGAGATAADLASWATVGAFDRVFASATTETVITINGSWAASATTLPEKNENWSCFGESSNGECPFGSLSDAFEPRRVMYPASWGCAASGTFEFFGGSTGVNLFGCPGTSTFAARAALCAPGYSVCSARAWAASVGSNAPNFNYWTNDVLNFSGSASGACSAGTSQPTACNNGPMRVCTYGGDDSLGNKCHLERCGFDGSKNNTYFGGCNQASAPSPIVNTASAGTLCCKN